MKLSILGRKLNAEAQQPAAASSKSKDVYVPCKRNDLSNEAKKARDAAMDRLMSTNKNKPLNISATAIKAQARKELEEEKKTEAESSQQQQLQQQQQKKDSERKDFATDGVFFSCPLISEEVLPKKDWQPIIKSFLYEQLPGDPGLTACLIIKNCNVIVRAEDCIETLKKYLSNIIADPSAEKFQRIRMSNRIYSEKVANVEGSMEFMMAAGFREEMCDGENFLVWSPEIPIEILIELVEALDNCEVIQLELDRNLRVLLPSQVANNSLPPEFYRITPEELKKEQANR